MLIKVNNPIQDGLTTFKRKHPKHRIKVHQGGNMHLDAIYASGGMVVSVFHNYLTDKEESKTDSIKSAIGKLEYMREMRDKTPEWVDEGLIPALMKAIRAAQKQVAAGMSVFEELGDPTLDDIEEECAFLNAYIYSERVKDKELDAEMARMEKEASRKASNKKD